MSGRTVIEGLQTQGPNEEIQYRITCTPAPTSVTGVTVTDLTTGTNVTATVMPSGSASVAAGVITLPTLKALTQGHFYRVAVLYSDGSNKIEPVIEVLCN